MMDYAAYLEEYFPQASEKDKAFCLRMFERMKEHYKSLGLDWEKTFEAHVNG